MPQDPPETDGPHPIGPSPIEPGLIEPDLDDAPATEEVLDAVVTEELPRPQTDEWYDIDAGRPETLSMGRQLAPWAALLGGIVLFVGVLWGLGVVRLPGLSNDGGEAACTRTCATLDTTVLRYSEGECVCLSKDN